MYVVGENLIGVIYYYNFRRFSPIFGDFDQFSAENFMLFLKTDNMIIFSAYDTVSLVEIVNFLSAFYNIYKII
jgi:hypothetical protein